MRTQSEESLQYNTERSEHKDFTHLTHSKRAAFTLAEVLITLGIIGVVAAITIPTTVHKFKIKALESAFKSTDNIIQSALIKTAQEYGYVDFNEIDTIDASIKSTFLKQFKIVKTLGGGYSTSLYKGKVLDYSGNYSFNGYVGQYCSRVHILSNGSSVCDMGSEHAKASVLYDTNGPFKGPNRFGYDMFLWVTRETKWYMACTKDKVAGGVDRGIFNIRGCRNYAIKNQNPDDKTKKYWDSL